MGSLRTTFYILFILQAAVSIEANAQNTIDSNNAKRTEMGLSMQWYPAGIIMTLNSEIFAGNKSAMLLRSGGNFINRRDYSPYNENENGSGFGGTLGYRRHFYRKSGYFIAGFNTDIWNTWINWKNNIGQPNPTFGRTYTLVLQPWIEAGYFANPGESPFQFGLCSGFGRELNIITIGKAVGQGWINSVSLQLQYSFIK
jgi:hypothetical protein